MAINDQGIRILGLIMDCYKKLQNVLQEIPKEHKDKTTALHRKEWLELWKAMGAFEKDARKTLDSRPLKNYVKDPDAVEAQLEALKGILDQDAMDMILFASQEAAPENFSPSNEKLAEAERMKTQLVDEIDDLPLLKVRVALCELNKAIPVLEEVKYSDARIEATNEQRSDLVKEWKAYAKGQYDKTYGKYDKAFI